MSQTPDERRQLIESIADRAHAKTIPVSDEAYRLWDQRDEAVSAMDAATNRQERDRAEGIFLAIHKDFLRALGMTPCLARDCTKFLTGRQTKYCSRDCRGRHTARVYREQHPNEKKNYDLEYLKLLKDSGDI